MVRMFVGIGLGVLLGAGLAGAEDAYHWPMDSRPALTSTFGEYRSGRFHAGFDLKTWGREGYPVLAVDDGYLWRIRTSPWGYGRAVYVTLRDGRTAVYAHLSGFASRLNPFVEAEQERRGAYSVNLFLKRDQVRVKRGEVLGYSGSTGIGVPHLHFELRDRENRPVNPLEDGFRVADTIPPTIRSLALVPLDAGARAADAHEPYVVGVRWNPKLGRYVSSGPIAVEGRVGVACQVYDRADASALTNKLAPYRLRLLVDGVEVFQTAYTSFGYDRTYQADLNWNFALSQRGAGQFHALFREVGNELPIYGDYRVGDGVLHAGVQPESVGAALTPGDHRIRVVAEDAAGNRAEAEALVLVDRRPRVLDARAEGVGDSVRVTARAVDGDGDALGVVFEGSGDGGKRWRRLKKMRLPVGGGEVQGTFSAVPGLLYRVRASDPHGLEGFQSCAPFRAVTGVAVGAMLKCEPMFYADFAVVQVAADRVLGEPPRVTVRSTGRAEERVEVRQKSLLAYEAVVGFDAKAGREVRVTVSAVDLEGEVGHATLTLVQQRVRPTGGTVRSEDGLAVARFEPGDAYRTFFGRVRGEEASGGEGLPTVGLAYRFLPEDVPFKAPVELALHYPSGFDRPERLGVYERKGDGAWEFVGNDVDPKRGVVRAEVRHFSTYGLLLDAVPPEVTDLRPAPGTETPERRPLLVASLRDGGSGIGREEDISVRLDGAVVIFEYDPEEETLSARPKQALQTGAHRLEVQVRDMCGNETLVASRFRVR